METKKKKRFFLIFIIPYALEQIYILHVVPWSQLPFPPSKMGTVSR